MDATSVRAGGQEMKLSLAQFLAKHLTPDQYAEMLETYGGGRHYIPAGHNYSERLEIVKGRYAALREIGVNHADAIHTLATETALGSRRIQEMVKDERWEGRG